MDASGLPMAFGKTKPAPRPPQNKPQAGSTFVPTGANAAMPDQRGGGDMGGGGGGGRGSGGRGGNRGRGGGGRAGAGGNRGARGGRGGRGAGRGGFGGGDDGRQAKRPKHDHANGGAYGGNAHGGFYKESFFEDPWKGLK